MEPPPDSELRVSVGGHSGGLGTGIAIGVGAGGPRVGAEVEVSVGVEIPSHRVVLGWDYRPWSCSELVTGVGSQSGRQPWIAPCSPPLAPALSAFPRQVKSSFL